MTDDDSRPPIKKNRRTPPVIDLAAAESSVASQTSPGPDPGTPPAEQVDAPPTSDGRDAADTPLVSPEPQGPPSTETRLEETPGQAGGEGRAAEAPEAPAASAAEEGTDGKVQHTPDPAPAMSERRGSSIVPSLVAGGGAGALAAALVLLLWPPATPVSTLPPGAEARLAGVEQAVGQRASSQDLRALQQNVQARLDALREDAGRQATAPAGAAAADPAFAQRLADLEQRVGQPDPALAEGQAGLRTAVQGLTQRLASLDARIVDAAGAQVAAQAAARLVLTDRLADALRDGRPLKSDLDALVTLGVAQDQLGALRAVEGGAATAASLKQSLREAVEAGARAERPAETPASGVVDRIWASAQSLVRVERVGEGEQSLTAVQPRLARALDSGDLPEALALWERLPPAAREASAGFGSALRARIAAERAAAQLADQAVAALGAGPR